MGRPVEMEERRRVVIYLSEADWKWVELQAEGNVSGWGRKRLLDGKAANNQPVDVPRRKKVPPVERSASVPEPVPAPEGLCEHKKEFRKCRVWGCKNYEFAR